MRMADAQEEERRFRLRKYMITGKDISIATSIRQPTPTPTSPTRLTIRRRAFCSGFGSPPVGTGIGSRLQSAQIGRFSERQLLYWLRSSRSGLGPPFASMTEIKSQGRAGLSGAGSLTRVPANGSWSAFATAMKAACAVCWKSPWLQAIIASSGRRCLQGAQ